MWILEARSKNEYEFQKIKELVSNRTDFASAGSINERLLYQQRCKGKFESLYGGQFTSPFSLLKLPNLTVVRVCIFACTRGNTEVFAQIETDG